ncbi:MAG TPA: 30S ribosomal protein S1 [Verrucomicrobiae bacterium]|nr:30S ribosomal protein S1 [Verrucomicrobiae bacterium]
MSSMQALLDRSAASFSEGAIVKGKIIDVRDKEVVIDIGYKSEGSISISEFPDPDTVHVGDEVEVMIERLEDDQGSVVISKEKADQKQNWQRIVRIQAEGGVVEGKVRAIVKGGLMVNVGCDGFLPASQIDIIPPKNLGQFLGQTITVKIVKLNEDRKNIVLSRREIIEEERSRKRSELLSRIQKGDTIRGTVKNITDFGAFIDLDGLDGLLHITDMSWNRLGHPSEMVKVGEELEVLILDIDFEKERVSLGLKQKTENPWEKIAERIPVGTRLKGKVTNLLPYGAFVEIEAGVEGLIHVSELSWTKRVARPSDVLKQGQEVEVAVLNVNPTDQKISLSLRALEPNPWDDVHLRFPVDRVVKGIVRNLTAYGAFVELEDGIDGMIHVSDMSWTRKVNHPSDILKKGEEIEAKVLEIDKVNQRISLGLKQLADDPWRSIEERFKIGDTVTGVISKIASFGAFVQLKDDIDGLVHISQISDERVEKVKDVLKQGQEVSARVIKVDRAERRIGLSIKAANYTLEQIEAERQVLDTIKPGEDLVTMGSAFDKLEEEYRPGQK